MHHASTDPELSVVAGVVFRHLGPIGVVPRPCSVQHGGVQTAVREQFLCLAGTESAGEGPPSALLSATTKTLHFVVTRFKTVVGLEDLFTTSLCRALSLFADSLPDKLMLCACLGALHYETECNNQVCSKILSLVSHREIYGAIFNTLLDVMQVQSSIMVMHCNKGCVMNCVHAESRLPLAT